MSVKMNEVCTGIMIFEKLPRFEVEVYFLLTILSLFVKKGICRHLYVNIYL